MQKCPRNGCGRKLVTVEPCPYCRIEFHPNCVILHKADCPQKPIISTMSNSSVNAGSSTQVQPGVGASAPVTTFPTLNLEPLPIRPFNPPPGLPADWDKLTDAEKSDAMMTILVEVRDQNVQLKNDINNISSQVNNHTSVIKAQNDELHRLAAEQTDSQHAFADRAVSNEIIINGLPKDLNLDCVEIYTRIFKFLNLNANYYGCYVLDARFVNHKKNPQTPTNSVIVEMVSADVCEKILDASISSRKKTTLSINNIFCTGNESLIYINHFLPSYFQNLFFQARQAKKRFGWKSVSTNNGNIIIKVNDQSPLISVCTLAQLETLTK